MQPDDLDAVADVVAEAIQAALAPVLERLAVLEARVADLDGGEEVLSALGPLRERLAILETKAALPAPPTVDLTPVLERVAAADARLQTLGDLRDRVVTLETKAALPAPPVDLGDVRDRLTAVETKALTPHMVELGLADLRDRLSLLEQTGTKDATRLEGYTAALQRDAAALGERVAVLEMRPLLPGPPGAAGKDGADGKDGTAGLSYAGVYQDGQAYQKGELVTWAGSSWHCNGPTTSKPGDGASDWTLMIKRGRDGRDGKDAPGALPVVTVGGR